MKSADEADQHSMLAISFVGQTAFLALTGEAVGVAAPAAIFVGRDRCTFHNALTLPVLVSA